MPDTLSAFARRCTNCETVVDLQMFSATRAVTMDLTREVRKSIKAAAPSGKLKGKRKRPAPIGAAYKVSAARGTGYVYARGPLQLIENDTKAHIEPRAVKDKARQARTAKQRRTATGKFVKKGTKGGILVPVREKKVLYIPGIGWRRDVHHPGTKGKHPWRNAVDGYEASGRATNIYRNHVNKFLREVSR